MEKKEDSKYFAPSELIINGDGSVFHLHVRPEQLADKVVLCGDPGRVDAIARHFDSVECEVRSREFHTVTGEYRGKRLSAVSTGIGCDNCDIVMNELDALKNIDFGTRRARERPTRLDIVRVGTCGGLQPFTPVGTFVCTVKSIGFDGLLHFYAGRERVCDLAMERAFVRHMGWPRRPCLPYVAYNSPELVGRIFDPASGMVKGYTVACGGFFGPQGRQLRVPLAYPWQNERVESFEYEGLRVTNFEMESSAIAGMAALMGHRALTVCMVIANRVAREANADYRGQMDDLIRLVLDRI